MEEEKTFKDFNDPLTERAGKEAVWVDKEYISYFGNTKSSMARKA